MQSMQAYKKEFWYEMKRKNKFMKKSHRECAVMRKKEPPEKK